MIFHSLLGKYRPHPAEQRWLNGLFVSTYLVCGRDMVKPVNRSWQLDAGSVKR